MSVLRWARREEAEQQRQTDQDEKHQGHRPTYRPMHRDPRAGPRRRFRNRPRTPPFPLRQRGCRNRYRRELEITWSLIASGRTRVG